MLNQRHMDSASGEIFRGLQTDESAADHHRVLRFFLHQSHQFSPLVGNIPNGKQHLVFLQILHLDFTAAFQPPYPGLRQRAAQPHGHITLG